ncbi:MAG: hypothetical protein EOM40_10100 [Clostridia bacterium]|nr:hypothetical protein [Clostridia bacterium]
MTNPDRMRLQRDNEQIYVGFVGAFTEDARERIGVSGKEEVKKLRAVPELRHREWKERGLMQPTQPEETPDYKFSDLQLTLYYDIYI